VNIERLCTAIKHIARVPEAIACLGAMEHAPKVVASYIGLAPRRGLARGALELPHRHVAGAQRGVRRGDHLRDPT